MGSKPIQDYLADLEAIGVEPGCSGAELQAAWRRRVSDLHPDRARKHADALDAERRQRLSDVNDAYRRLRHFQRLHGRMPGTAPGASAASGVEVELEPRDPPPHRPESRTWLLALFNIALICLLATVVWVLLERAGVRDHDAPVRRTSLDHPAPDIRAGIHLAPFRNKTTSTVCNNTSRSNTRLWLRT